LNKFFQVHWYIPVVDDDDDDDNDDDDDVYLDRSQQHNKLSSIQAKNPKINGITYDR
jgi:hypothetical protein